MLILYCSSPARVIFQSKQSVSFVDMPVLGNDSCVSEYKAAAAGDMHSVLYWGGVAWTEAEAFPKPDTPHKSC